MVDITEFDTSVALVMGLAIVIMSFLFPALGLADIETGEGDIPEFNITADRFDFAGESPPPPGTPTNIQMDWNGSRPAEFSDNQVWLDGDTEGGTELLLLPNTTTGAMEVRVNVWNSSGVVEQTEAQNFNSTGDSGFFQTNDYTFLWSVESYETVNGDVRTDVSIEIQDQPVSDGGWIGRIPVIGGAFSVAEATAATLAWFASIVLWGITALLELVANGANALFDLAVFWISLWVWLASTYGAVIEGAEDWATIFVSLPGILLSLVFAKFIYIIVRGVRG